MNIVDSIKKTVSYSQIFDYPQNTKEIELWLIANHPVDFSNIKNLALPKLSSRQIKKRSIRHKYSQNKKTLASKLTSFLKKIPTVWFVGLTGSVAAGNAKKEDDLDIMVITAPSTLWLTRPLVLLYLEIIGARRRKNTNPNQSRDLICPNLWLDTNNLRLPKSKQNIYTAHEVLQVYPLINKKNTFENFISKNSWTKRFLANAYQSLLRASASGGSAQNCGNPDSKYFYPYSLLAPINFLSFLFQFLIMLPYRKGEDVGVGRAFFHSHKFQEKVLNKFSQISYNQ